MIKIINLKFLLWNMCFDKDKQKFFESIFLKSIDKNTLTQIYSETRFKSNTNNVSLVINN